MYVYVYSLFVMLSLFVCVVRSSKWYRCTFCFEAYRFARIVGRTTSIVVLGAKIRSARPQVEKPRYADFVRACPHVLICLAIKVTNL